MNEFEKLKLESRKLIIERVLKQDAEVRAIVLRSLDRLIEKFKQLKAEGRYYAIPELIDSIIVENAVITEKELKAVLSASAIVGVNAGMHESREITFRLLNKANIDVKPIISSFFRISERAVDEMERRRIKGLKLSERIWGHSKRINNILGTLAKDGIQIGEHPIEIAKRMQQYVNKGASTLVSEYPNMMERIGHMVPDDLSYEALRLARTEIMGAYGISSKMSAENLPSAKGMKWSTSNSNTACKKCQENASNDNGMGAGIYRFDELPDYPAHPNCMCQLTPELEDTDSFVDRLIEWTNNPMSQPDIEQWYQEHYKMGAL
ncbi:hypothetical protein FJQ98_14150 [Lysinibacillus agricola]|uniref:Phage head morphogenesis domain-containing protein n=1 Tax=Lysinibacillus agricola TaxID=2590012 RepID=A0ABX7AMM8_9BACI|nr:MULTISPECIES: hypothetical protein [Lysinibacillus]KOS64635.1 hypothetical protein AN161_01010 [Lysinibacillus sp. FJAT-14222]QQP10430.1 hypothetical protein FJQ98_14150 [Lysinibacillus agricola]